MKGQLRIVMLASKPRSLLVVNLVILVVVVGCAASPTSVVPTAAPTAMSRQEPPAFYLFTGGNQVEGFHAGYCWTDPSVDRPGLCADALPPTFQSGDFTSLENGEIALQLGSPVPDRLNLGLSKEPFGDRIVQTAMTPDSTARWEPDVPAGDYILSAFGQWDDYGDSLYLFPITLP